jgi:hypothetical protein
MSEISDTLTLHYGVSTNKGAFSDAPTFSLTPDPPSAEHLNPCVSENMLSEQPC